MDGFLIVDKEKEYTSFDVCNKIKHLFNIKKVGHTGTLDPNATGVLVVALGKACKALPLINEHEKEYIAKVRFGKSTKTIDPEGEIIEDIKGVKPDINKIDEALEILKNRTTQIPPIYSALKVNGKRLYEYARENKEVEIKERSAFIYEIKREALFIEDGYYSLNIKIKVSKGFYVRSFVRDLGEILNIPTLMQDLRRTLSGEFSILNSKKIDLIKDSDILPLNYPFKNYFRFEILDYLYKLVLNGIMLDERQLKIEKPFIVTYKGKDVAIYEPCGNYKYKMKFLF